MVQTPKSDVLRLAFYGSTSWVEARLRPTTRDRQREVAERTAACCHGEIVVEFFDESNSAPLVERPEGRRLLEEIEKPERRFDGVVLAAAARAGHVTRLAPLTTVLERCGMRVFVADLGGEIHVADIDDAVRRFVQKQSARRAHELMGASVSAVTRRWSAVTRHREGSAP